MTRPNKHIQPKKCGPAKTSFGLKSGHGQPTVPCLVTLRYFVISADAQAGLRLCRLQTP